MEPRGKPVTTSVPSISVKFHANAEQLEELYASDEEHTGNETAGAFGAIGISEPDSSPLKYLPRLIKRSTSIDITPKQNTNIDASPSSDPWRFFSDIKGKITKSVEEKITEIKSRNQEEGSPLKSKTNAKDNSKENSSISDSEDLSESSISKTCGIVSTTEGAEMSSDDDTPSIEKDKKTEDRAKVTTGLRQRFRLLKAKSSTKEGTISKKSLTTLYNINSDKIEQALPEETDIESAVDALEDSNLRYESNATALRGISEDFDNIVLGEDNVVNVKEIYGSEVREVHWATKMPKTVFAPVGFVDMRMKERSLERSFLNPILVALGFLITYSVTHMYSNYLAGFLIGALAACIFFYIKSFLDTPMNPAVAIPGQDILQVPAVQEYQPLTKYEGWVNELPDNYNPHTYHISQTQSVYLRLQGNLLRLSHTRSKIPKRALWNEPKHKPSFTHHRIYNLLDAQIDLLPEGLAKKRHWSKKYPICITLTKDQMVFDPPLEFSTTTLQTEDEDENNTPTKPKRFSFAKKKRSQTLRFSKLSEENEEFDLDSESRASTPSMDNSEPRIDEETKNLDDSLNSSLHKDDDHEGLLEEDFDALSEDWGVFTPPEDDSPSSTKLYIFGRTDREKEDWFRRLKAATHNRPIQENFLENSQPVLQKDENDYVKYMLIFNKRKNHKVDNGLHDEALSTDILWINAFVGRILFDCLRDDQFTRRIKDKIQKKLSSIKLPYVIECLTVTELSLGHTPPLLHKASKPIIDERGLWIDVDITYEGTIVLILQTKLNLMKLKQPPPTEVSRSTEKPAIFNSDIEDSAESTSDEENMCLFQAPVLDASGVPVPGLGGSSNTTKKVMKMVDRIAESKFFQAATEYRYIKKAMEGVSNTELRLKVEVKELVGTLVLNVPAPPTDRVWIGFRPTPNLALHAQPIVGERNITFLRITSWIEKKLILEFQKLMVIPNMEDFILPVMSPKLPE